MFPTPIARTAPWVQRIYKWLLPVALVLWLLPSSDRSHLDQAVVIFCGRQLFWLAIWLQFHRESNTM